MNKIRILVVEPNKEPYVIKVEDELGELQNIVGGLIQKIELEHNVDLICNEEGRILRLKISRITKGHIILGTFFIVGQKNGDFISLSRKQIHKYKQIYSLSKHKRLMKFLHKNIYNNKFSGDMIMYGLEKAIRRNMKC